MEELQKLINKWKRQKSKAESQMENDDASIDYYQLGRASAFELVIIEVELILKKRSSKRRRSSPEAKAKSNVRKAGVARSAKRRTE